MWLKLSAERCMPKNSTEIPLPMDIHLAGWDVKAAIKFVFFL